MPAQNGSCPQTRASSLQVSHDILTNVLSFEVSHRKWRLVSKQFSRCVALHIVVDQQPTPEEEVTIIEMLGYPNCRSLRTTDWALDAFQVALPVGRSRSIRSLSIAHSGIDSAGACAIALASLDVDVMASLSFGQVDLGDDGAGALAEAIRHAPRLTDVVLERCEFGPDGLVALAEAVAASPRLRSLTVKACTLEEADLVCLLDGVCRSSALRELALGFTPIGVHSAGAAALGDVVCLAQLERLGLDFTNLGDHGIQSLAKGLAKSKTLTDLSLKGNHLGDAGVATLAEVLAQSPLRRLVVSDNNIGPFGVMAFSEALQKAGQLEDLHMGSTCLGLDGCLHLARAVVRSGTLKALRLQGCSIDSEGVELLGEALGDSRLETLELGNNQAGLVGVQALAKGIAKSQTLRHLDLTSNLLDAGAAQALALALCGCKTLQSVELGYNCVDVAGAEALGQLMAACDSLQHVGLSHSGILDEGAAHLGAGLAKSPSLRTLDLQACGLGVAGAQALAQGIAIARRLVALNVSDNLIGDHGARALAWGIAQSNTFQALKAKGNAIGYEGTQAVMEAMQHSLTFSSIELACSDLVAHGTFRALDANAMVRIRPDPEDMHLELVQADPGLHKCTRCKHTLHTHDFGHGYIIYTVDRAGIITRVMHPDQWAAFAEEAKCDPNAPPVSEVVGQPLSNFMLPRLADFYFTLCSLILEGEICHTQFHWYCDDPRTRRQMVTFIYHEDGQVVICNVTKRQEPHNVPVEFMNGSPDSLLWRCAFCGWCSCEGGDFIEPEDFHIWCLRERPALLKHERFYAVVCEGCMADWVARHDNPEVQTALEGLRPIKQSSSNDSLRDAYWAQ
uniref:Uncharacterized protein n=1 Tax=Eutreptiella gymnastica TaxID=73025 RepID=A0A7S1N8M4_9EUGL